MHVFSNVPLLTSLPSALCCSLDWDHWKSEWRNTAYYHTFITYSKRQILLLFNNGTNLNNPGEPVQTVTYCDVDGLPKYSVPPLRVRNNLHRKKWDDGLMTLASNKLVTDCKLQIQQLQTQKSRFMQQTSSFSAGMRHRNSPVCSLH